MNHDVDSQVSEYILRHHQHETSENQTSSVLVKRIRAPVKTVWSVVRRFDEPQRYKPFVQSCSMQGDVKVGSVREVCVISGLPATTSTELLETLDDEHHILSHTVLGGDHRLKIDLHISIHGYRVLGSNHQLKNYRSIITLHSESIEEQPATLVLESYVVDVPDGNTKEDTQFFVEALIKCNLKSLADICERLSP